jgi:hypothetical protein
MKESKETYLTNILKDILKNNTCVNKVHNKYINLIIKESILDRYGSKESRKLVKLLVALEEAGFLELLY